MTPFQRSRRQGESLWIARTISIMLNEIDRRGLQLQIVYHSHPDHPAQWSKTDLAEAHWFGCSYVITSIEKGKAALTNAFELTGSDESDKRLVDEDIAIA